MTKEQQIKDLSDLIYEDLSKKAICNSQIAEHIYNAGYRKESKNYIGTEKVLRSIDYRPVEEVRKETAKEILLLLGKGYDETKMTDFKNLGWYKDFCRELNNRYGVEVEE